MHASPDDSPADPITAARPRTSWWRRLGLTLLVVYFVAGASFLVVRHIIWEDLDRWQPQIEKLLASLTGHEVRITGLKGQFAGFSPGVTADSIRVVRANGEVLFAASEVSAGLNWRTLLYWSPVLETLTSRSLEMRIERTSESLVEIAGRRITLPEMTGLRSVRQRSDRPQRTHWELPDWLMAQQSFRLEQVDIHYRDLQTGASLSAHNMSLQSFERDGQRGLSIDVPRISGQNGSLQVRATLGRSIARGGLGHGTLGRTNWHGEAWVKVTDFDFSQLAALARQAPLLNSGIFNGQAWFTLARSSPANARLLLEGSDVVLVAQQSEAVLQSLGAQVDAVWSDQGDMELTISHAQATDREGTQITVDDSSHTAVLNAAFEPVQARFSMQAFDAQRFHQFAMGLPIPVDMRKQFAGLLLRGWVTGLEMEYDARRGPTTYNIRAQFEDLSIGNRLVPPDEVGKKWAPQLPAAENISGAVDFNERGGQAKLHGRNSAISFPGVFARPRIGLDSVQAELNWRVKPKRLPVNALGFRRPDVALTIDKLKFSNKDAQGDVSGTFQTLPAGPGKIEISGQLYRADASKVHRYLPLAMLPKVRNWMKESFVSGKSEDVRFELRGDLRDFPFRRRGSGEFLIDAFVEDATFRYAPRWPKITRMRARVRIRRGGLEVIAHDGRIYNVALRRTRADIADFRNAVLRLNGTAVGSAQQMIRYVNDSPIGQRIDGFTHKTRISGNATTELSLTLPFRNFDEFSVSGATALNGSTVRLTDFLPTLSRVKGNLLFSEVGIAIDKMRAHALGGPVTASAKSPARGITEMRLSGRASATGLRRFNNNILTRGLKGDATYTADIRIDKGVPTVTVNSDLAGMQVALPPPMYKHADIKLPVTVKLNPLASGSGGGRADELTVSIPEDRIQAVVQRRRNSSGLMRVNRAVLSVGSVGRPALPVRGLKVAVAGIPVNADRWIDFWSEDQRANATDAGTQIDSGFFAGFNLVPSEITMVVPSARFLSKRFHDVVVGATRVKHRWKVNLATTEANGYVAYQDATAKSQAALQARFSHLHIPQSEVTTFDRLMTAAAEPLPSMDIRATRFRLRDRPLGKLILKAVNQDRVWQIDELSLQQPSARFAASGKWRPDRKVRAGKTDLDFDLDISNAGVLLSDLGMPKTLRGGSGKLSGELRWHGSLFAPDINSLGGQIDVALGRGQFLRTEPGMAKLIGVLNLQALPRRLSLDFSDVFENGFAFDAIVGRAAIEQGIVKTESLLMNGIQAEVLIAGRADIPKETQALSIKVAPNVNAGIASLAYAALANPAVGLGTLLAQIILDKPLREIFSHEFEVTGSWRAPTVTQIERFDDEPLEPGTAYSPG